MKYIQLLNIDTAWEKDYKELNSWLKDLQNEKQQNEMERVGGGLLMVKGENPCKTTNTAFYVQPEDRNSSSICRKISRQYCGEDDKDRMILIHIPNDDSNFYASNGTQLLPGESYCIYKPLSTQQYKKCNEIWGFWKYSSKDQKWICHSKVPGIYNAELDKFDPCQREDPNGKFLVDGKIILPRDIPSKFAPQDFYSTDFQSKCECQCDKSRGYIFNPKLSRTSCYKDPCLLELPPFAAAGGLVMNNNNSDDNNYYYCDCGEYFTNLLNNPKNPCTACPFNTPSFDPQKNELTVYIKCYNDDDDDNNNNNKRFGIIPCSNYDDKLRGCTKAIIKVKHVYNNKDKDEDEGEEGGDDDIITFKERVGW